MLALPISRRRWLVGRLLLATGAAATISLTAGLFTWAGVSSTGAHVQPAKMLEAGVNSLPVAVLFLGIAALVYALVPAPAPRSPMASSPSPSSGT